MGVEPTGARCSRPPTDFEDRGTHRGTSTPILSTDLQPIYVIGGHLTNRSFFKIGGLILVDFIPFYESGQALLLIAGHWGVRFSLGASLSDLMGSSCGSSR